MLAERLTAIFRRTPLEIGDHMNSLFGIAATVLAPMLILALALTGDVLVLLALIVDGSVAVRYWAGVWRGRAPGAR